MISCTRITEPRSYLAPLVGATGTSNRFFSPGIADQSIPSDSSILPEDMANQSVRLKEEQLRREEEKLREVEFKVQREIQVKRQELLAKEDSLKVLEARLGQ